jgi:hypothetical protein
MRTNDLFFKKEGDRAMRYKSIYLLLAVLMLLCPTGTPAENIDPDDEDLQYCYGENVGWLNAEPLGNGGPGIEVTDSKLTGYIWGENIGWMSLSCKNTNSCLSVDYGVVNDGFGRLAGYAWAENVGWISMSCRNTLSCRTVNFGVTIDPLTGIFSGRAWAENIGWITFSEIKPVFYGVITSWVAAEHRCEGDFEPDGDVDGKDLAELIDSGGVDIDIFAADLGRIDCP